MPKTVQDVYNSVTEVLCEPSQNGTAPGLSLGIVTLQQFLDLFSEVVEDYSSRLGLVYSIFTQQLLGGVSTYDVPEDMNQVKEAYVGGQNIDFSTLFELDQWLYQWNAKSGTPEYWHQDGLAPKSLGVALTPNYTGASYFSPVTFTGTVNTAGSIATWDTGDQFLTSWNNYTPAPTITINSVDYTLSSVTSSLTLEITGTLGTQAGVAFSITIPDAPPPYGVYGLFNGATIGQYSGVLVLTGTSAAWGTPGALFDPNWNNYYPRPNILLSSDNVTYTAWPVDSIASSTALTLAVGPGSGVYFWKLGIGNDGNLTMVGPQGIPSVAYTLDSVIPATIPDSFVAGLAYGILARIFAGDSECRDLQRAAYCSARYQEFISAGGAISGNLVNIG